MTSDDHDRFRASVAAHLAEIQPDDEAGWFERHARECASCAEFLERARQRMPGLAREEGHAPVSLLERWVREPLAMTALEKELLERHLRACETCRGDAEEMARLAGLPIPRPLSSARRIEARTWLVAGAAAAAVLAIVFALRFAYLNPPYSQGVSGGPSQGEAIRVPRPMASAPGAQGTLLIVLNEQARGSSAGSGRVFRLGSPEDLIRLRLPQLFISDEDSVEARIFRDDLTVVWMRLLSASALRSDLTPDRPSGGWKPGRYRLSIVPAAGRDTAATRVFDFELVDGARSR